MISMYDRTATISDHDRSFLIHALREQADEWTVKGYTSEARRLNKIADALYSYPTGVTVKA